ncbi:MAG: hypothetical protein LBK61_02120 [Spirochaetaceae bacterium]|jgi:hypothetical protein|nr:hypothetical protein [Spirochaetaceae bacterium]
MSVLKNKRGLSKLEFYHNARTLREDITNFLLRDFGVRDKVRKMKTPDNLEVTVIEEYPEWLIVFFRGSIIKILRDLMMNIMAGNTIYPVTLEELAERRRYQTAAIINCEQLLSEMAYCADILPVELGKFTPYAEKIAFEIRLLKGWRKSGNELAKRIKDGNIKGGQ